MAAPTNNMRSLDRAFDVLGVLQDAKQPLRLSEVARHASLHVATVQRILGVLLDRGYAARIGDTYTAGPAALAVAHAFMVTNPLSVLAQPTLQQLAANTGFTASMYVRVENSRVLIARVESEHPLSYVLPVGERLPLYLGGAGKTILAHLDAEEVETILAGIGDVPLAGGGTLRKDELPAQLDKIRSDGFAVSVSERLFGIVSVTAPVRAADGTLVAVLGVTGPTDALDDAQIAHLIPEVRRAATTLGARVPVTG
ncbi:IclR family transcriptional regulator [Rhodococcus sp. T2V]|uniref:IclR family transcriptional regulator n=1 Tax=Rhodococcus sp. T2V TaxID=3034164 RepID=UPI0023E145B9|nr:IclR family transcriptional regulator [Rhodococcus sp. T2V]MDF3305754.1 IclR family transcriptional regulator [Rhodococcus sp. T2V]